MVLPLVQIQTFCAIKFFVIQCYMFAQNSGLVYHWPKNINFLHPFIWRISRKHIPLQI